MLKTVVLVGLLVAATVPRLSADATTGEAMSVYAPTKVQGGTGDTFVVQVAAGSTMDIGAFQFTMTFDEPALSLVEASPSQYYSDAGAEFCPLPVLQPGQVQFGCSLIYGDSIDGPALLAELVFEFNQATEGTVNLGLAGCLLAGPLGNPLAVGGCKGTAVSISAEPPASSITLSPSVTKTVAQQGSTITIDAVVSGVTELGGFEFDVVVDPSKLTFSGASAGPFFDEGTFVCVFQTPFHDFACVHQGKDQAITGSGVIAHLDFTVKAPFTGTTAIALADCGLADEQGFEIPVDECGGATIQSNAPPPPTPGPPVGGVSVEPLHGGGGDHTAWPLALAIATIVASGAYGAIRLAGRAR